MKLLNFKLMLALAVVVVISSCSKKQSSVTGWNYNDSKNGGFQVTDYKGQETGPGLVFIQGGTFVMGNTEQDVMYDWNTVPRRITVSSYYIDETEIANVHYREYLYWMNRVFGADFPEVVNKALPDTLVWRDNLAYNEPYVEYYFRHPAYDFYPVVGVNWLQANDFASWRSDRVNERILINKGVLAENPSQVGSDNFNTEAYELGKYEGAAGKRPIKDLNPSGTGTRHARMEDGIMLPNYRLPTEAEWEYAALGLIGNQPASSEERITDRRIYPWNGTSTRYPKSGQWQGSFLANFKRGRGDNMGVAGKLNDNADITAPVKSFMPNDFGLYNMAGNVNEWVLDVYRPMTSIDASDFRSFRGNQYQTKVLDADGNPVDKDSLGHIVYRPVTQEESANRRNYRRGDVRDYLDGDEVSNVDYKFGLSSMVNNDVRVYKGGSWKDRAYYLAPGARRFLDQSLSTDDLGFRCAMDRVGSPAGNFQKGNKGGNNFPSEKGKRKMKG
ncbi:MAG TPA: SUMF1/EgtB/PvdO family nonheme iron enzyme [Chitinophagales bacterium]|nr:SUMF1/EgtB/PvdO family nonheme iron enzyme [Chitinophagales bacterium]